ncbi:MAG: LysR family transcriptional regulator [Myxococcota bacterium]
MSDVTGINANLLVALDTLLEAGSVTEAAHRLRMTQSGMSNVLAKLRDLFGDPLLVRQGRGLVPTAAAIRIRGPLRRSVAGLQQVLTSAETFDPRTAAFRARIKASEFALSLLLPRLLNLLDERAPAARVELLRGDHYQDFRGLASGEFDAYVGFCDTVPSGHFEEPLLDEHLVCVCRPDHPVVKGRLTLTRYLKCEHVVVSDTAETTTAIDTALAERGQSRRVKLAVPHFLLLPALVAGTDLLGATNSRSAAEAAGRYGLEVHPLPVSVPAGTLSVVWHGRTHADPAHEWFRSLLAEAL